MELVENLYKISAKFPDREKYGITSQMLRCSVSIPSNIAEGRYRSSQKEFAQFLSTAYGSGAELETQLEIAKRVGFLELEDYSELSEKLTKVMRMLNSLIGKVRKPTAKS